jgi:hypothetical protein
MSNIKNLEELFVEFFDIVQRKSITLQYFDQNAGYSFYIALLSNKSLTKNQANFVMKILKKYKDVLVDEGIDADTLMKTLPWKKDFRVIDNSKRVSIDIDEDGIPWVNLQFPFAMKAEFDKEFNTQVGSQWDPDKRVRRIPLYQCNFLKVEEFVQSRGFELDDSFMDYKDQIDDIWQNKDQYEPYSEIIDGQVILKNANTESTEAWNKEATGVVAEDLLLAREMGFFLRKEVYSSIIERIAASSKNLFWTKDMTEFFTLYKQVNTKCCVILDRSSDYFAWLKKFVNTSDLNGIDRRELKVCFREDGKPNSTVNNWIKDNNVGGKVSDGRIFIFLNSPAKWLYKDLDSFKIIATNGLFPFTSKTLQCLLNHHSCVINISDDKPAKQKEIEIEEL